MTAGTQTDSDFAFAGLATPEAEATEAIKALAAGPDPLGALAGLLGTWKGHGFNAIWRPHNPASQHDRFLELNKTDETLVFTRINGPIPNRGLAMADIDMFGLTYMQQIRESSTDTPSVSPLRSSSSGHFSVTIMSLETIASVRSKSGRAVASSP